MAIERMTRDWNVVLTEPQREFRVAERFVCKEFEPYVPSFEWMERSKYTRDYRAKRKPLLPGYVFVRLSDDEEQISEMTRTPGVRGMLLSGESPARVSDDAVAIVREVERDIQDKKPRRHPFKIGDHVRINRSLHPSHGLEGIIQRLDKTDRVVLRLMMPGRASYALETAAQWLTGVEDSRENPSDTATRSVRDHARH